MKTKRYRRPPPVASQRPPLNKREHIN